MSENIEKHVLFMFLPCLVNKICILIHFTPPWRPSWNKHILLSNWVRQWIPLVWKHREACFIWVSTMLIKKVMHISKFYPCAGGHFEFRDFEALVAISRLGIQRIRIQHPSKPPKSLYAINLHKMPPSLLICTFSEILPSLSNLMWFAFYRCSYVWIMVCIIAICFL